MMKKALAAAVLAGMTMSAQASLAFTENFDSVASLASKGWVFTNASTPVGVAATWLQGNADNLTAQAGAANSFASASYLNSTDGGTLNNWLITPEFDATGGARITFWLNAEAAAGYSDQLAYGFSNGSSAIGSFTLEQVLTVPTTGWTMYTATLGADTVGMARFAFQYTGAADTANYIGLDTLTVDVPEPASIALMAGGLLGLGALRRRQRA